jgi:hypothetical protein
MAITREADRRDANWQVECAYTALSALLDDCLAEAARSIECGVRGDEAPDLFQYLSLALPAGFFAAPFFSLHEPAERHHGTVTHPVTQPEGGRPSFRNPPPRRRSHARLTISTENASCHRDAC